MRESNAVVSWLFYSI